MASTKLRDYQRLAVDAVDSSSLNTLLVAPTGAGKSVMLAHYAKRALKKRQRFVLATHRREIISQLLDHLMRAGIPNENIGLCVAGHREGLSRPIIVGSIQTLSHTALAGDISVLCIDEAHRVAARTYRTLISRHKEARIVGATATPYRLDGVGLAHWFESLVETATTSSLIDRGLLARPAIYSVPPDRLPDVGRLKRHLTETGSDYSRPALEKVLLAKWLVGDIVAHVQAKAHGLRTLVFAVSLAHAEEITASFVRAGTTAAFVSAKTPLAERDRIMRQWSDRTIQVVCNCELFAEGLDLKDKRVECVVLARPTTSRGLYLQQAGRGMRPGGTAIILDHAGNTLRHNTLPTDDQEHALVMTDEASRGRVKGVKLCRHCFAVATRKASKCLSCGNAFPSVPRTDPELISGELVEVNPPTQQEVDDEYARVSKRLPDDQAMRWTMEKFPGHAPSHATNAS